jgi:hypothetical protein
MIGYSVPAVEKRRIWALAKQFCETTPILELHYGEPPILTDIHTHQAYTAEDFITAIDSILKKSA